MNANPRTVSLGCDFGTSGARAIVLEFAPTPEIAFETHVTFTPDRLQQPVAWKTALETLLAEIPRSLRSQLTRIAINGTSGTVLLCDRAGQPVTEALLYNDGRGATVQDQLCSLAPPHHCVQSATSSLAKLLWWQHHWQEGRGSHLFTDLKFLHQADWLAFLLHGQLGYSDYHNALKLGYDVTDLTYPTWLTTQSFFTLLPQVREPGCPIAPLLPQVAKRFQINPACEVCAGTTDSIAAFLASGAHCPGEAVTSLGSTLVLKLLSSVTIADSQTGIYSHRLGSYWLTGGASNTGGAVLQHFFSPEELNQLSRQIDPHHPTGLPYYPLLKPGERFPVNDPQLLPVLDPRPGDRVQFLQGLLESMARIEAQGYHLLQTHGASPLIRVYSAGGGAQNPAWTQIRQQSLGVPVLVSPQTEAAYGTAKLAKEGLTGYLSPGLRD